MVESERHIMADPKDCQPGEWAEVSWVWIDLDDTLQDFGANSHEALLRLYDSEALGRWFSSQDEWVDCYKAHNVELWGLYAAARIDKDELREERFVRPLVDGGCSREEAGAMAWDLDRTYLDYLAQGRHLVPYAIEILKYLKERGYRLGILSNGFKEVQYRKIATAGIGDFFDAVVLSDDIGIQKPDARLFEHAMSVAQEFENAHPRHAIPPTLMPYNMVMIGDNPSTDVDGALGANWRAIYFNRGGRGRRHDTALTVTSLMAIEQLL